MESVRTQLRDKGVVINMPPIATHIRSSAADRANARMCDVVLLGGTNLAAPNMLRSPWKATFRDTLQVRNKYVFFGVGWKKYSSGTSLYTRSLFRRLLSHEYVHAVRDSYTEERMREMGFDNVVTTGCPTLWGLQNRVGNAVPRLKQDSVVFTLTDYNKARRHDTELVKQLLDLYDYVYFWPQGHGDAGYLSLLGRFKRITVLGHELQAFDSLLNSTEKIDYVGTRLHGGIRSMQFGRRSIIIGIDNRAIEMGQNFGLTVISRSKASTGLSQYVTSPTLQDVSLPLAAIDAWVRQFRK